MCVAEMSTLHLPLSPVGTACFTTHDGGGINLEPAVPAGLKNRVERVYYTTHMPPLWDSKGIIHCIRK